MNDENMTVKGIFLIPTIEDIKEKGTEKDLKKLEVKVGSLKFSPFKNYPISYQVEAEKILCHILYGDINENAFLEFGKRSFKNFAGSNIGNVMFALFGKKPEALVGNIEKLYNTVTSGIDIKTKKLADNKFSVRIYNDPYLLRGSEGVLAGGMEYLGVKYKIKFTNHGGGDHEFIVSWK